VATQFNHTAQNGQKMACLGSGLLQLARLVPDTFSSGKLRFDCGDLEM
jgi:hypothetical protein